MQTFELLDRFELLYPTNSKLADLRRSYIDLDVSSILRLADANEDFRKAIVEQNLHSIFRLINNTSIQGSIEDFRKAVVEQNLHSIFRLIDDEELRKAVVEQNLHSIFRLIDDEDLRKLILEDNIWKLWSVLERYINTQFIAAFKNFFVNKTKIDTDCFSRGQLQSKIWLVNELKKCKLNLGTVYLCAGWYATLATMLFESKLEIDNIRSFDIDSSCVAIAEVFNKPWVMNNWKFKATTKDIMAIDYDYHCYKSIRSNGSECELVDNPDTIINTSCEHLPDFKGWYSKIPTGKLIIIQANDYHEIKEHVNTYNTLEEFSSSAPMTTLLYKGELSLSKYKRFMLIGYK